MVSTASYLSFKANVESMLSWLSVRKAGSREPAAQPSSKDIFSVMVTPDRIPKFVIPSLDAHTHRDEEQEAGREPSPAGLLLLSAGEGERKGGSERSNSEPSVRRGLSVKRQSLRQSCQESGYLSDHSDPPTRAAMSLPHLQKITTPYGFLALGEVPHIKRKESLFFEGGVAEMRLLAGSRAGAVLGRSRSTPLSGKLHQCHRPGPSPGPGPRCKANRSVSWESISPLAAGSPYPPCFSKDKSKLQLLIKKHLGSMKRMRCSSSSEHLAERLGGSAKV
ncbi:uncharacterized protein LOC144479203 [Mustelus asterias]